jgi:hypothetical protein
MKDKQISFLSDALDFLDDVIRSEEQKLFYRACLSYLANNEQLLRTKLSDVAKTSNPKDPKTYVNWLDWLIKQINDNKSFIWETREVRELTRFPMLKKQSGSGGSGNETVFYIEPVDLDANISNPNNSDTSGSPTIDFNTVHYLAKKLKRTPWYLKICSPFFEKTRNRQFLLIVLLLYSIAMPISLGLMLVKTGFSIYFWAPLFAIHLVTFGPVKNILSVTTRKITLIEDMFQPLSSICLAEITDISESRKIADVSRRLISVQVEGKCPICTKVYGLENSVILEKQSIFKSRIIGRCLNNPQEHLFTFDKDLMSGIRLIN